MDHHHGNMPDMFDSDSPDMSMIWNWNTDIFIVFPFWRTYSTVGLLCSSGIIFALSVFYEWFQEKRHSWDRRLVRKRPLSLERGNVSAPLLDTNSEDILSPGHTAVLAYTR